MPPALQAAIDRAAARGHAAITMIDGAVLMSLSTVVVAVNVQLLRRARLQGAPR